MMGKRLGSIILDPMARVRKLASDISYQHLINAIMDIGENPSSTMTGAEGRFHFEDLVPVVQGMLFTAFNLAPQHVMIRVFMEVEDEGDHWTVGFHRQEWHPEELRWVDWEVLHPCQ